MTGPLRERDDADVLLAAETERALAGTGRLVLLRGASGTGRTAVLDSAARGAADRGLRVLRARCSPDDTAVPFATVVQLLGPVPEFTEVASADDERGSAALLWRLLRAYADEGPVLLAVDDVHLADDPSRRWLTDAARRIDRLPVLLVATERSQYDVDPRPAGLTQALSPSLVRTHTLAPLSDRAAAGLVRAAFPEACATWAAECVRAGAGSPLLLHALLDDLGGTPHPDGLPPVPDTAASLYPGSYPAAVSWWLKSAGPVTAEVARSLAALEQAWPAAAPARRGEHRHALPHPEAPAPGTPAARARGGGDTAPGCRDVWSAEHDGDGDGFAGRGGAAPGTPGAFPPAPGALPAYAHGAVPYVRDASPYRHGALPPYPHGVPPYAQDASMHAGEAGGWAPEPGSAAYGAQRPPYGTAAPDRGGPDPCAEPPGPHPHPAEHPAGPGPGPGPGPADAGRGSASWSSPWYPFPVPYGGRPDPAHGAAAPGRPDPAPYAPDRSARWGAPATPSPAAGEGAGDPVDVLAEAVGADPARIAGWLAAMTRLGLLRPDAGGRPRYAHPLLRDAVLTGWPRPRREAVHRAAAEAMLRRGDRVEAVARHLLRTPAVRLPWALRVLRDAVTVAVHDARPADAVAYLRRALDEPLSDGLRQRLLTELGSLEYASADTPAAIARLAEAQHLPADPRNRVRTAVALGTALAGRGEIRTAMEVLRRTEGRLAGHPELARTVQTAGALLSDEDLATRQEVYRGLSETGRHSPELVGTAGQALLVRYAASAALISADEAMARIRDLLAQPGDPLAEPFLLGTAAAVAQWADELDEADRLVERGLAGQHPALLHPMQHALLNTRADIAAARGDHARLLAPVGRGPGTGPTNQDAHALMALVHTGRTHEALRFADRFDLREMPENWELNRYLYARGVLRAATGDPAGALHDFLECGRRQGAREVVSPVVTPWRTAVAECRLALGGGPEALALATEELRLARVWNTPRTVGRALRVLGSATGGRRGLELTEEAVRTLRDAPADTDMELIPALLAQGRLLLDTGERGRARARLREAAELAERKGALRWLTQADQALRVGGARRSVAARTGAGALTGSERRIAELAADGRTNTEIADLLHLARRTVETHLTSTYRKLRIRRRTELPGALRHGAHPNPQS
ncbi:helix-turn-helix transcriptional regulator [Streptomyces olivaceus]|uniref:helix-turn-helix transcriptional regulator n=1 Tax=Streptomyces olivaceus TaxID=47716 RepID=UPI001CC9409E|nr:AAA family ATPase [Streptomyces olivaceus]MBZ6134344.1 AAA family ATPase [Streptomyces olivaceus]